MAEKKIKIVRTCFAGGQLCEAGSEVSLPEDQAQSLLRLGRAVPAGDQKKTKPAGDQK